MKVTKMTFLVSQIMNLILKSNYFHEKTSWKGGTEWHKILNQLQPTILLGFISQSLDSSRRGRPPIHAIRVQTCGSLPHTEGELIMIGIRATLNWPSITVYRLTLWVYLQILDESIVNRIHGFSISKEYFSKVLYNMIIFIKPFIV